MGQNRDKIDAEHPEILKFLDPPSQGPDLAPIIEVQRPDPLCLTPAIAQPKGQVVADRTADQRQVGGGAGSLLAGEDEAVAAGVLRAPSIGRPLSASVAMSRQMVRTETPSRAARSVARCSLPSRRIWTMSNRRFLRVNDDFSVQLTI